MMKGVSDALRSSRVWLAAATILAAAAVLWSVGGAGESGGAPTARSTDRWGQLALSPLQRTEVGAARIGSSIFLVGGFISTDPGATTNQVARYDIDRDSWSMAKPMPTAVNHPAVAAFKGRLYVHGGFTDGLGKPTDRLFSFDPASGDWRELRSSGLARGAHALVPIGGKLYAPGGADGTTAMPALQVYDPKRNRWRPGPPMKVAREHIGAAAVGGKLFVIAGRSGGKNLTVVERYDPAKQRWKFRHPVSLPRSGFQAARVGNRIVVAGGEQLAEGTATIGPVEEYLVRRNRWRALPPLATPRHGLAVVARGNRVFALEGGPMPGLSFSGTAEFLDLP